MNDLSNSDGPSVTSALAQLEQRVRALETKVAAIPDAKQIEERVTAQVKATLPPPIDPTQAPSFKDIEFPIPDVQTIVSAAKAGWTMFAVLRELNMLFWTLFDRRYHMAWITRIVTIGLLALIFTSQLWLPLAFDNIVGRIWEKIIILVIAFIMFFVLHFEMRRYQDWRNKEGRTP
jgi:hypothetical protein